MKKLSLAVLFLLLAACQNNPPLENDARHLRYARVVAVHVYSEQERRDAARNAPRTDRNEPQVSIGLGFGTNFGGINVGVGTLFTPEPRRRDVPPQPAWGADRYTVEPLGTHEKLEVNSYGKYRVGDCVKLFSDRPGQYARLFDLQPGERCGGNTPATKEEKKPEKQ